MKDMNIPYIAGLVIRAQHSDSDAFAELYALTYNKVYNYTRHYPVSYTHLTLPTIYSV